MTFSFGLQFSSVILSLRRIMGHTMTVVYERRKGAGYSPLILMVLVSIWRRQSATFT